MKTHSICIYTCIENTIYLCIQSIKRQMGRTNTKFRGSREWKVWSGGKEEHAVVVHSGFPVLITLCFLSCRPAGSQGKESACNVGDVVLIPRLGRSPGKGNGNPLQSSCLENSHRQRSLVGYRPWGLKESDTTERLTSLPFLSWVVGSAMINFIFLLCRTSLFNNN